MTDDNRDVLGRLIREELEGSGRGPASITRGWTLSARRSFYTWRDGVAVPSIRNRAMLEDALGWRRGVVTEVLSAPITREFSLSEVRDWSAQPEPGLVKARDLSTDELLAELVRRVGNLQAEVDAAHTPDNVVKLRDTQDMYDVAANSTAPGRNMEHLEDEGDTRG